MPTLEQWPNKLGYDVHGLACGAVEVQEFKDGFGVRTFDIHSTKALDKSRCLRVPYSVTTNPITAALLCQEKGLSVRELEDMDYPEANKLYMETLPTQKELF